MHEEDLDATITVRLTGWEHRKLRQRARSEKRKMADLARSILLGEAEPIEVTEADKMQVYE